MNFLKKLLETFHKQVPSDSETGQLSSTDFLKTLRDGLLVAASAGVAYLLQKVPSLDLGQYTALAIPAISFALTAIMRFLRDNQTK